MTGPGSEPLILARCTLGTVPLGRCAERGKRVAEIPHRHDRLRLSDLLSPPVPPSSGGPGTGVGGVLGPGQGRKQQDPQQPTRRESFRGSAQARETQPTWSPSEQSSSVPSSSSSCSRSLGGLWGPAGADSPSYMTQLLPSRSPHSRHITDLHSAALLLLGTHTRARARTHTRTHTQDPDQDTVESQRRKHPET